MATIRKIDLMHREFGFSPGNRCKTCQHFCRGRYHDYMYSKCKVYGITNSEASDWSGRYDACGMYNKEYSGGDIIRLVRPGAATDVPIAGQMALTDSPFIYAEYFEPSKEDIENAKTVTNCVLPNSDNTGRLK